MKKKLFVNQGHFGILTPILPNSKPSFQWRHSEVVIIYPWYIQSYQWLISENLLSTGNALISEKLCKVSREQSVYQHEKRWHYPVKCCLMYSMGGNAKKRRSKKGETCITGSEKKSRWTKYDKTHEGIATYLHKVVMCACIWIWIYNNMENYVDMTYGWLVPCIRIFSDVQNINININKYQVQQLVKFTELFRTKKHLFTTRPRIGKRCNPNWKITIIEANDGSLKWGSKSSQVMDDHFTPWLTIETHPPKGSTSGAMINHLR